MIRVIDSQMGIGKSKWGIQHMNDNPHLPFLYVTPFNDEVKRIVDECPAMGFKFAREGHKQADFRQSLINRENIASTHECFKRMENGIFDLFGDYTLILDEVAEVVTDYPINRFDLKNILDTYVTVDENNFLIWREDKEYKGNDARFKDIKDLAESRRLMIYNQGILLWLFPADIFAKFKEVYVLTHLFAGQIQKAYFDKFGIEYEYLKIVRNENSNNTLIPHDFGFSHDLKHKVHIYEGSANYIGDEKYSLSSGWYKKHSKNHPVLKVPVKLLEVKSKIYGVVNNNWRRDEKYFLDGQGADADNVMWTCFLGEEEKENEKTDRKIRKVLKGKGYTTGFVSCTCRATNKYEEKRYVVYPINRYLRPPIKNYLGMSDDQQDIWALSEMIQFIWRSAIRKGKEIWVYVPSERMRDLLKRYLDNKISWRKMYETGKVVNRSKSA